MPASPPHELPADLTVDEADHGKRIDAFIAAALPGFSRSLLRKAIDTGAVAVDGTKRKPSFRVETGMTVRVDSFELPQEGPAPQAIALDILHEDDDLIVVNKPPGMVVHPAKGHWEGTLASALAHHFGQLSDIGGAARPGIVHRLDRDTSGVLVVAKHNRAHEHLAAQFHDRTTEKRYLAITQGVPDRDEDVVDKPIGDHPHSREKKAVRIGHPSSRDALTRLKVLERFRGFALVECMPKTGRTHQIRLHLAHIHCAVLCDRLYGGRNQITEGELTTGRPGGEVVLARQALHATQLSIDHPTTGERVTFQAKLPTDIEQTVSRLRAAK
ncbi:Pseudouridine synthase [Posidoniimonas polymericola]|uniref:Pseudouridine synthase n=1 Tax=Posidoniimonas polymericola TaxID=2528002 RepID=A0A5C5YPR9_9BACT|nr:RluA family pseudouridine synthase [Posidoniimonas polymericola]TWT76895.1 Pseudouridine synthase [Posidoniimonas polymericola]